MDLYFFLFFSPWLDGLPLPTTPSTKKARAGQLNKKDQIAKSLKVPMLINAAHLRRGIRGAMRDGPTSTYAHCNGGSRMGHLGQMPPPQLMEEPTIAS